MKKKITIFILVLCLLSTLTVCAYSQEEDTGEETTIILSDAAITVDGEGISTNPQAAVYEGAPIIYYEAGKDSNYGEGSEEEAHTPEEAAAQTVVTITQPGVYRVKGILSQGQLSIDLGAEAKNNPEAIVTLIMDGADITCAIAPALIIYNVWESESTETAGFNIILADGSENILTGSHVARVYQEGTTKKLYKYDGALSSNMTMLIEGETTGSGILRVNADYEGIETAMHLTINGGNIYVEALEDGINSSEDWVSVTTINGGYVFVNGGIELDGDGIDSNGSLVINGGVVISYANPKTGDGGLDADGDILLNGGTVIGLGSRNDAASINSEQAYIELSFASTQEAGELIRIEDTEGNEILTFNPAREYQSFTYSSAALELDQVYYVYSGGAVADAVATNGLYEAGGTYSGGVLQQYTGNSFGFGPMGGGFRPEGLENQDGMERGQRPNREDGAMLSGPEGDRREMSTPPDGEPSALEGSPGRGGNFIPDENMTPPDGQQPPEGFGEGMELPGGDMIRGGRNPMETGSQEPSTEFVLTETNRSFSGVSDAVSQTDKTVVEFNINDNNQTKTLNAGNTILFDSIQIADQEGNAIELDGSQIQITIIDVPSANYAAACLLSDGWEGVNNITPTDPGNYELTVSVVDGNVQYTGYNQWRFTVAATTEN